MEMNKWNLQLFGQEEQMPEETRPEPEAAPAAEAPAQESPAPASQQQQERAAWEQELQNQRFRQHILSLEQQGQQLKQQGFADFDLRKELANPVFARMTAPGSGISVEDAYYAVHHREIQARTMEAAARNLSNAIRSGSQRPREGGIDGQGPSVTHFDYRKASREQREALKKQIRQAAAEGRKLYPGM